MNSQADQLESLLEEGQVLLQKNRLQEAKQVLAKVCHLYPDNPEAWFRLSNVNGRLGDMDAVAECCRRALALKPDHGPAHVNLGNVFFSQGRLEAAAAEYQAALQIQPRHYFACFNLGNVFYGMERYDDAASSYQEAVQINPGSHLAHVGLGHVHMRQGAYDQAADSYMQALRTNPEDSSTHSNLGLALYNLNRDDEAIASFQRALDIDLRNIVALNNLGTLGKQLGRLDAYVDYYRRVTALMPDATEARRAFIENIGAMIPTAYDPWLDDELKRCLSATDVNSGPIAGVAARHLKRKYGIQTPVANGGGAIGAVIERIGRDDLFLLYLRSTINTDPELELWLTVVRRALLFQHGDGALTYCATRVISAMAYQCLNNEYVFCTDKEEEGLIAELKRAIEQRAPILQAADGALEGDLRAFGMYERLYALSCREHLNDLPLQSWSEEFLPLREQALANLLEEDEIKRTIPTLGDSEDEISRLVQSQYEENPYPRWICKPSPQRGSVKAVLTQLFPHFVPPPFLDGAVRILVAGCGTGQQPIVTSLTLENVDILAVDISRSSLAYAIRMARKFNVNNIQFMQGDILALSGLENRFHIIESTGVLHHMKDPLAGWRVLTGLLVDNGLMRIGLYSEKDRLDITAVRNLIAEQNLTPDKANIRALRARMLRGELGDGVKGLLASRDFYSTSGCRDLIFHYQEHQFTLPRIAAALGGLGLDFIGFRLENDGIKRRYQHMFPEDKEMTNLALWDRFEQVYPHTFAKMYDFWCQKQR